MRAFGFGLLLASLPAACSSSSSSGNAAVCTTPAPHPAATVAATDSGTGDGGIALAPNGDIADPGGGGLYLTASGEALAVTGYDFPPASADATFLVDGWIFRLDRMLVTVDHVELWDNPDAVPANQSEHGCSRAAHVDGPWAIDLHKGGPLTGEGGSPEQAQPFASIKSMDDGSSFDTTARYAFGFQTVAATASAKNVNLDADGLRDYADMIAHGYTVLYVGTVSRPASDACTASAGDGAAFDFAKLPKTLPFRLGFATPTSYVNCQNGSEFPGSKGINSEDYLRGVQFRSDRSVIGQITIHADHPFWESFAEDSALRFDQIAAHYVGVSEPVATIEDMRGVDFTAFTDEVGAVLPMRTCVDPSLYTPPYPVGEQLHFDPLKVLVSQSATDPRKALRDYYDYVRYTQSTQGHLNSQGLCFVSRNFPSPAGGS